MGFVVGDASLDDSEDGFIIVARQGEKVLNTESNKVIGVNEKRDCFFKRFIIAHEIGHYAIASSSDVEPMFAYRENRVGKSDEENDVDYFAACLLLPKELFISKYKELTEKNVVGGELITRLTKVFEAPMISVVRRFDELNIDPYANQAIES